MKQVFPNSKVYGTNLETSNQYEVCKYMAKQHDWKIVPSIDYIPIVDLVFASEYFEHFENPINHLEDILKLNPKYFIIANSFSSKSVGHFDIYYNKNSQQVLGKKYGKVFNSYLRTKGYYKVNTSCYNDRPSYWKREDLIRSITK